MAATIKCHEGIYTNKIRPYSDGSAVNVNDVKLLDKKVIFSDLSNANVEVSVSCNSSKLTLTKLSDGTTDTLTTLSEVRAEIASTTALIPDNVQSSYPASEVNLDSIITNTIQEKTADNGIIIDGLKIKDGMVQYAKTGVITISSPETSGTSNGVAGRLSFTGLSISAMSETSFTITNTNCTETTYVMLQLVSFSGVPYTNGVPMLFCISFNGGFTVTIKNMSPNPLSGDLSVRYVLK